MNEIYIVSVRKLTPSEDGKIRDNKEIYTQEFSNLDVAKLALFLNQEKKEVEK